MAFLQGAQHWGLLRGAGAAENRREDGQCGGAECGGVPHPRQRVSQLCVSLSNSSKILRISLKSLNFFFGISLSLLHHQIH